MVPIVAIAWLYVALMMALAEAQHPAGTVLGAFATFVLYGVLPVVIVVYLLSTPARRRAKQAASARLDPDRRSHPATVAEARTIASKGEEPGRVLDRAPASAANPSDAESR